MIITRSPLRISLGGGGTDLPSYYRDHTGFIIAAAIDKYVYITLHHAFTEELIIKSHIDEWYTLALNNGALGGKLIGAGGGGFLMFYAEDKVRLRRAMREARLNEVRFRFDFEGTKVIIQS